MSHPANLSSESQVAEVRGKQRRVGFLVRSKSGGDREKDKKGVRLKRTVDRRE